MFDEASRQNGLLPALNRACQPAEKQYTVDGPEPFQAPRQSPFCRAKEYPMRHMFIPAASRALVCLLALSLLLPACGGKRYSDGDLRESQAVRYGVVVDVTEVMVYEDPSLVGPAIGLAAGGLLGSAFGAGTGRTLFVLGGGLLGADVGGGIDYRTRNYKGLQLTLELDNGNILMVVQGYDELFVRGDEVRIVIIDEERARVQHI